MTQFLAILKLLGINFPIVGIIVIVAVLLKRKEKKTKKAQEIDKQSLGIILGMSVLTGLMNAIHFAPFAINVTIFLSVTGSYVIASVLLFFVFLKLIKTGKLN